MKQKMNLVKVLLIAFVSASALVASAGPGTIVYSGKLLDSAGNIVNGTLDMTFSVYDASTAGTLLYGDRNTAVTVTDGLYSVVIGDDPASGHQGTCATLKEALEASSSCFIEISIGGTVLTPREKFQAVPYAISSLSSGSSGANASLALDNLANVAVNTHILPGTANSIDLGSATKTWANVYSNNISDSLGNTTAIANIATVSGSQTLANKTITGSTMDPTLNSVPLASGKVLIGNNSNVAAPQSISGDISITSGGVAAIQTNAITNTKIVDSAVTSAKIAAGTIVDSNISDTAAIANAKLANSSVTVTAGDGLTSGGSVSLGGTVSLAVNNTVVRTTGDQSVSGVKTFGSIPLLPGTNPSAANEAVRKAYVDSVVNGLSWKNSAKAASVGANLSLTGEQTIDDVPLAAGDRILVKNQTAGKENGIYVVSAGGWTRAEDMDASAEVKGAAVFVTDGTSNKGKAWVCNNTGAVVLDTTALAFAQFASPGVYTAGNGLSLNALTFAVDVDDSTIGFTGNKLQIKSGGITSSQIANSAVTSAQIAANAIALGTQTSGNYVATVSGNSIITATGTGAGAAVTLDLANGSVSSTKIAAGTIVDSNISATAGITDGKLATIATAGKVAGSAVELNGTGGLENSTGLRVKMATGSGLTVNASGVRMTICNKTDATVPPTMNNDVNDTAAPNGIGYVIGSVWVDTVAQKQYVCVNSADGAAVWSLLNPLAAAPQTGGGYSNRSTIPWVSK